MDGRLAVPAYIPACLFACVLAFTGAIAFAVDSVLPHEPPSDALERLLESEAASADFMGTTTPPAPIPALSSRQVEWRSALKWCESRGVAGAINPKDKDGTPSYGYFQFKPGTFYYFANLYGVATSSGYMDGESQMAVVTAMLLHREQILWEDQFPDCVLHHIGQPPP